MDDDDWDDVCIFCEAFPEERHQVWCHLYAPCFGELAWCDACQSEFATTCACDGHDCEG